MTSNTCNHYSHVTDNVDCVDNNYINNQQHISKLVNGVKPGLIQPLQYIQYDYRNINIQFNNNNNNNNSKSDSIRCIQFNIERGYRLNNIIALLQQLISESPTSNIIISLQEIDIHCARSQWNDIGHIIAKTLQLNYIFLCEFIEVYSKLRSKQNQGGGIHGNAILTTFNIQQINVIKHQQHYDWLNNGHELGEPRVGERATLCITIEHNNKLCNIYNTHSEIFCGIVHRLITLSELFNYIKKSIKNNNIQHHIILADLNTQAHSIARLSHKYCRDNLRYLSLGWTESEFLVHNVLNHTKYNNKLEQYVNKRVANDLINPYLYDPYDCYNDVTLHSHYNIFQGKLDWILLRHCKVLHKSIYNHNYTSSDHKLLCCDIILSNNLIWQKMLIKRSKPGILTCSNNIIYAQIPTIIVIVSIYILLYYIMFVFIV